ncbi:D-threo-aldose 1-dehydrogenase [Actinokineospora alba]|uniref:D-threo-aldose 1-dehydrogenase n=1 Tax=Actinokineospora alba TaxID=504798 RepID=A0A1H0ES98_9PSEU|nr:aldo/keto reductase [Actinokineospora alba]TDP69208.1 D-threo-aldose 1-dehydrogenase [Actinokineospora alba]SDI21844.1 D-threo-aldose 1-dehydrogenase [Actinokineospora alba]SDN85337.1 D-threo-aldose 1-dehydrogenase [Actinokineospora alba]
MKSVRLGGSKAEVTGLGFGGAGIGNLFTAVSEVDARGAVDAAWAAGVRYFDTAPHYGLGLSERRLGAALADRPRSEYVVSTKVGRILEPGAGGRDDEGFDVPADYRRRWDFSADGVRRSIEDSLVRLGMDRIDVVLLHDPDDHWAEAVGSAYPALHDLRSQGVVGAIGVGMNQWEMPARFVAETDIDVVMLAGRYTLLDRSAAPKLLPLCLSRGVSVIAAGVFNSGVLATDTPGATYDYAPVPEPVRARVVRMAEICRAHRVSLPQAAIAFAARHPAVASVVVGAQSADQFSRNASLYATAVPDKLWDDLP